MVKKLLRVERSDNGPSIVASTREGVPDLLSRDNLTKFDENLTMCTGNEPGLALCYVLEAWFHFSILIVELQMKHRFGYVQCQDFYSITAAATVTLLYQILLHLLYVICIEQVFHTQHVQ